METKRGGLLNMRISLMAIIYIMSSVIYFSASAQSTDCGGAIGICSNQNLTLNSNGAGSNDFSSGANNDGCLDGENQSAWLFIQIQSGTTLGFVIDPQGADDYDFAIFGPNRTCNNLGSPIRCSWAAGNGNTGLIASAQDVSENAAGNGFVRLLDVMAGETYLILIDNYDNSNQGFTLTWGGNASLDCSVTIPCPPVDLGPDTTICDANSVMLGVPFSPQDTYLWSNGATTNTITVSTAGTYWLEVSNSNCTEIDSIEVFVNTTPQVDLGNDTSLCENEQILLDANTPNALSYLWQDGTTLPLKLVDSPGLYTVRVSNGDCFSTDEIQIDYDVNPVINLGDDTTICDNATILLESISTSSTFSTVQWHDGSVNPTFVAASSYAPANGIHWVEIAQGACTAYDSIFVDFIVSPIVDLGPDENYCEGDTVYLGAFYSGATSYLWSDGSTLNDLETFETGIYWVEVSNNICATIDSVTLTFLEYPELDLQPDTILCEGDSLVLSANSSLATDYLWQDGSANSIFTVGEPGIFFVESSNDICSSYDSIEVNYNMLPIVDLGPDTIICKGSEYVLTIDESSLGLNVAWQDNSAGMTYVTQESGAYYVDIENQCGSSYDTVIVEYGSCDCNFFLPTGFTPNNDGVNDYFQPLFDCDSVFEFSMQIFNRWGELVFETSDTETSWDEPNDTDNLLMDVYTWIIAYKWRWRGAEMFNRESGHTTIIR